MTADDSTSMKSNLELDDACLRQVCLEMAVKFASAAYDSANVIQTADAFVSYVKYGPGGNPV
jgi:hypothetical protein